MYKGFELLHSFRPKWITATYLNSPSLVSISQRWCLQDGQPNNIGFAFIGEHDRNTALLYRACCDPLLIFAVLLSANDVWRVAYVSCHDAHKQRKGEKQLQFASFNAYTLIDIHNYDTVSIASSYLLTFIYIYYTAVSLWKAESPANTRPYTIDKLSELVYLRKTGVIQANKDAKSLITDMYCLANAVST